MGHDATRARLSFSVLYERSNQKEQANAAERHYTKALEVYRREVVPANWAMTQYALGFLFSILYERTNRLDQAKTAESHYIKALEVYRHEVAPSRWATMQYALGSLYSKLYDITRQKEQAQAAQRHYSQALEVNRREVAPSQWAMTQHGLGGLFLRLYERSNQEEQARAAQSHYTKALEVYQREVNPSKWAGTQHSLGNILSKIYQDTHQKEEAQAAQHHYSQALEEWTSDVVPVFTQKAAHGQARLLVHLERWAEAEASYQTALEAAQNQYLAASSNSERQELMVDHAALFAEHAFCLCQLGQVEAAFVRLDEGRARLLGETLRLEEAADLHHGTKGLTRLRAARQQLAIAEANYAARQEQRYQFNNDTTQQAYQESVEAVREAWQALKQLIQDLQLEPPILNADDLAKLPLPADTAVIALLLGNKNSHALLLHQGQLTDILLPPSCTKAKLRKRVRHLPAEIESRRDAFNGQSEEWFPTVDEITQSASLYQIGWFWTYFIAFSLAHRQENSKTQHAAFKAWQHKVQETLDFLAEEFWPAIVAGLPKEVKQVLLMPSGVTTLLPLHAAAPAHLSVAYIPSLSIWQRCQQRTTGRKTNSLFLATPANDLPFTEVEAEWLTLRFPPEAIKRLLRPQATADAILTEASGHGIVHFSGHATYNWVNTNYSGLICKESFLSLATIRRQMDLSHARLVTLSACETGVSDVFQSGEEFIGLPAGLLEAGAPAVVASLWPVHDISTAFLMDRFYELWLEGELSINQALQQAAHWLRHATKADLLARIAASPLPPRAQKRIQKLLDKVIADQNARMAMSTALSTASQIVSKPDQHPFAHPFYWAAFAAYGAVG